jgi:acetylornithine deacetylase/succinyl-diaminopimelate desuccinylase family protein
MKLTTNEFQRLANSPDKNEIVNVLQELIRFKTVNPPGNESECAGYVVDYLRDAGATVATFEPEKGRTSVVATIRGSERSPSLLLNGHMDVVAAGEDWTIDPFEGVVQDGKVIGRGAADQKSGIAAAMVAAKAILESDVKLKGDLIVEAVADEESLGPLGTRYLLNKGIKADMAINTEPTNLRIEVAQRGVLWLEVKTKGRAAHGGRPWVGISSIYQMVDFLTRIKKLERDLSSKKHPLVASPTINVGTIEGGMRINVVPSSCTVKVDRRLIPGETSNDALSEIRTVLEQASEADTNFKAELKVLLSMDPFETPKDHPMVTALQEATMFVSGTPAEIAGEPIYFEVTRLIDKPTSTSLDVVHHEIERKLRRDHLTSMSNSKLSV